MNGALVFDYMFLITASIDFDKFQLSNKLKLVPKRLGFFPFFFFFIATVIENPTPQFYTRKTERASSVLMRKISSGILNR